jgi:hypothetical protein
MPMTMRKLLILALLPLTACATVRQGLGEFQRAADKGFEVSVGEPAPTETATTAPAAKAAPVPTALVGDTANRRYTTDAAVPPK